MEESFNCPVNEDFRNTEENGVSDTQIFMLKNEPNAPTLTKSMSYEEFVLYFLRTSDVICVNNENSNNNCGRNSGEIDVKEDRTAFTAKDVNFNANNYTEDCSIREVSETEKKSASEEQNSSTTVEKESLSDNDDLWTWTNDEFIIKDIFKESLTSRERKQSSNKDIGAINQAGGIIHSETEPYRDSNFFECANDLESRIESQENNVTNTNCQKCGKSFELSEPQNKKMVNQLIVFRKAKKKLRVLKDELNKKNKTKKQLNRRIQQEIDLLKLVQKESENYVNNIMIARVKLQALIMTSVFFHLKANEIENICYDMELKLGREHFDAEEKQNDLSIQEEEQISDLRILETRKQALWDLEKKLVTYKMLRQKVEEITKHNKT